MKARVCLYGFIGVLTLFTIPAAAQDRAAAEAAFREGRELMKAGRYAEACEKLALSQRLDPAVGTLTNLGVCHEKLGKLATAWTQLNEAADLASRDGQSERADKIRAHARTLEPRLTRLLIRLAGERPAGLVVTRDGTDVTLLLGTAVPLDPGSYTVQATAGGVKPWSQTVEATGEGETITVEIPVLEPIEKRQPEKPAEPEPRHPVPQPDPVDPARDTGAVAPPPLVLGLGIGGLAATAVGLGFGWRARAKYDDSRDFCDDQNLCSDEGLDLIDSAYLNANISNVLIGVGVASMAGAGVLWYLSSDDGASDDHGARLVPSAGSDHAGVVVWGRF